MKIYNLGSLNIDYVYRHLFLCWMKFILVFEINTVSYIDSIRGLDPRPWRQDLPDRRAGYCLRHGCKCGVWLDLLDHNFILTQKA